jgi:hypothetical protein|tara:strand:- start:1548 stop:1685 length:138 start_codon:yes stop_codon:yes gene_type:complete
MDDNSTNTNQIKEIKSPDENSGVLVESKIKIFDPETSEVYLEGRA